MPREFNSWWGITGSPSASHINHSGEGLIFTDPTILTDSQVSDWESQTFPDASSAVMGEINQYYPPPWDAWGRYVTNFGRVEQIIAG